MSADFFRPLRNSIGLHGSLCAAIMAFLALRLLTSGLLVLIVWLVPVWISPDTPHDPVLLQKLENGSSFERFLVAPWYRWDTVHYLEIAQSGYANLQNTVWPPLYPLLIRFGMALKLPPLYSALLVSNLAAVGVFWLLYSLVSWEWDSEVARRSLAALVVFPTAFFLVAGYSESLFLVCAIASVWSARKNQWLKAGIWAAAATLTRHQGVFLILPMAWEGYKTLRQQSDRTMQWLAAMALPVAALLGFGFYVRYGLGADWPWQTVGSGWEQHLGFPWEGIAGNLLGLLKGVPVGWGTLFFNLSLALLSLGLLIGGFRQLPVSYSLLGWAMMLSVLIKVENSGFLGATARYSLIIFPIFIILARLLRNHWLRIGWTAISLVSQALLLAGFYWWTWVP